MSRLLNLYVQEDNWLNLQEEENKARLINDLLREHYKKLDLNSLSIEELKKIKEREAVEQEPKTEVKNG